MMTTAATELLSHNGYQAQAQLYHRDPEDMARINSAMSGKLSFSRTVSDLLLHYSNTQEHEHYQTTIQRQPEITLGVLIEGTVQFALDGQQQTISVNPSDKPRCFVFNLATATQWTRITTKNNQLSKLLVTIPHHWVTHKYQHHSDMADTFGSVMRSHKKVWQFTASDKTQRLCLQACQDLQQPLVDLELEGLALHFIAALLQDLSSHLAVTDRDESAPPTCISDNAYNIYQYLENHVVKTQPPVQPDLKTIAHRLGMSVSSAQRCFKQSYRQTIVEFVRNRRLAFARELLLDHKSIGEVAYLAGYKHSSNFAIAFKKMYGIPPGEVVNPST